MTRFGKATAAVLALVLASCGAASEEVQNEDIIEDAAAASEEVAPVAGPERFGAALSPELPATEEAFRRAMSEPLLLSEPAEGQVTQALLDREIAKSKALSDAYRDVLTREESVASRHTKELAVFREGQLFLRFGCSVARSAIPARLAEDQRVKYKALLAEQAQSLFANVHETLDAMPEWSHEELARHVVTIREARPQTPDEVAKYCETTEPYWLHPSPRTVEATLSEACEKGDGAMCWVWGTIGEGGQDAVTQGCTLGYQPACGEPAADAPTEAPVEDAPSAPQPAAN